MSMERGWLLPKSRFWWGGVLMAVLAQGGKALLRWREICLKVLILSEKRPKKCVLYLKIGSGNGDMILEN